MIMLRDGSAFIISIRYISCEITCIFFLGKSKSKLTNLPSKSAIRHPDTPTKPHPPIKSVSWASDSLEEGEELTGSQLRRRLEEFSTDSISYVQLAKILI